MTTENDTQSRRVAYRTGEAPSASGAYSQAVQIGDVVWVAGQAGLDPKTRQFVGNDIQAQCHQTLRNLAAVLESAGLTLDDVVRVGVFLADLGERSLMNDVYRQYFTDPFPARTTVGAQLPDGMRIEIDAMAVARG